MLKVLISKSLLFICFFCLLSSCNDYATFTSDETLGSQDNTSENDPSSENSAEPSQESASNDYILPVTGAWPDLKITDSFGPRILNGVYDFHRGLDISQNLNDPIYASAAGTVVFEGTHTAYPRSGNFVILEHNQGKFTGYLHLNGFADNLTTGDQVTQGQLIGYAGQSGDNINTVHLHFSYFESDTSGEIPSFQDTTLPPLSILTYDQSNAHSVEIANVNTTPLNISEITVNVQTPATEMDINEITLTITNDTNQTIYSKSINFANRENCGTDTAETNNVEIIPEDFVYPESSYDYQFKFKNIDLSNFAGQNIYIEAKTTDIHHNTALTSSNTQL